MLEILLGEWIVSVSNPKSGKELFDQLFGVWVRLPIGSQQGRKIGEGFPKGATFVHVIVMAFEVKVFLWVKVFHDGVEGTLVVERDTEKEDAFVFWRQGPEFEMDDKGIVEQLAEVDAQLLEQRRLLFLE